MCLVISKRRRIERREELCMGKFSYQRGDRKAGGIEGPKGDRTPLRTTRIPGRGVCNFREETPAVWTAQGAVEQAEAMALHGRCNAMSGRPWRGIRQWAARGSSTNNRPRIIFKPGHLQPTFFSLVSLAHVHLCVILFFYDTEYLHITLLSADFTQAPTTSSKIMWEIHFYSSTAMKSPTHGCTFKHTCTQTRTGDICSTPVCIANGRQSCNALEQVKEFVHVTAEGVTADILNLEDF